MKCAILVSDKMAGIPLAELGGVVLNPGEKLLVACEMGDQMKKHYGKDLIIAGYEEKLSLKHGYYEVGEGKAVIDAAKHASEDAPAMADQSADKSMQAKAAKVRRK